LLNLADCQAWLIFVDFMYGGEGDYSLALVIPLRGATNKLLRLLCSRGFFLVVLRRGGITPFGRDPVKGGLQLTNCYACFAVVDFFWLCCGEGGLLPSVVIP